MTETICPGFAMARMAGLPGTPAVPMPVDVRIRLFGTSPSANPTAPSDAKRWDSGNNVKSRSGTCSLSERLLQHLFR